jgi:hypothetical protein
MLKLERISKNGAIGIRVKERSSFFDNALVRALLFSTGVHLVLLCGIRIKMFEFTESVPLRPINVAIESENGEGAEALVDVSQNRMQPLAFSKALDNPSWIDLCLKPKNELQVSEHITTTVQSTLTDTKLTSTIVPLNYRVRLYPLQIKCSSNLKVLKLIDDGSSLFKEQHPSNIYPFTSSHYPIEYNVQVAGSTGKIVSFNPKKELIDKELQEVADRLMQRLSFAPREDKLYTGSISLHFCCSGEKIGEYLQVL